MSSVTLLAPRRRLVQLLLLTVYLVSPLISWHGVPFMRVDVAGHTLYLAFQAIRIDEFFLVLLLCLVLTVAFLLMTALLGRVWCGWLCPQTLLNDLVEWLPERLKARPSAVTLLTHVVALVLSVVLSLTTLAYFLPVQVLMRGLLQPGLHPVLSVVSMLLVLTLYLNVVLVRRSFCRRYCPYGRLQTAFMNEGTLNLTFREEVRDRCIRCNSCVRTCPMGVDIRQGFQIECINCGRCLDACRLIMAKKDGSAGLIAYRFGSKPNSRPQVGGTTGILLALVLLTLLVLTFNLATRSDTGFALQRNPQVPVRLLADGRPVQAWQGRIENRSQQAARYRLELVAPVPDGVVLLGQLHDIAVAPNQNRAVALFVQVPATIPTGASVQIRLVREETGRSVQVRLPL